MTADPHACSILYTDIEGSTALWDSDPAFMNDALGEHDELLTGAVLDHGGRVLRYTGDGICAVFDDSAGAAAAAVDIQRGMQERAGGTRPLKVRVGLHHGVAFWSDDEPRGPLLNESSRLMSAAHGGQIVVSSAFANDVLGRPHPQFEFVELGIYHLRGVAAPFRVLQLAHDASPIEFPALRARPADDPLGARRGALIGRQLLLAELRTRIAPGSLVTLWGPAGVGKTRLAIELARRAGPDFVDGATVVECSIVSRDDLLADAFASALGLRPRSGVPMTEAIGAALGDRHQLIVLDNCEHVLPAIRQLATAILAVCPGLAIVATSRTPLRLRDELLVPVQPLRTTPRQGEDLPPAVVLFAERLRRIDPHFEITGRSRALVLRICQSLDGLPLALELAAAQARTLSLTELEQSAAGAGNGFEDAATPADYVHATLSQAISWSHDALDDEGRRFFESISIFAGPFSSEAAAAVGLETGDVGAATSILRRLVDRSVVQVHPGDDIVSYQLLDSVRRFGRQRLAARGVREAHELALVAYYCDFTATANVHLQGPAEAVWVRRIEREFANIRQAQSLATGRDDIDSAMRLMANMFDWALWRMHYELTSWALELIRREQTERHGLFPAVSACAIYGLWAQGNLDEARQVGERALAVEARLAQAPSLLLRDALASLAVFDGRLDAARVWAGEWERESRARKNSYRLARALYTLTIVDLLSGNVEAATANGRRTLALARETRCPTVMAFAQHANGLILRRTNPAAAGRAFERAAELAESVDNELAIGLAQRERAQLEARSSPERGLRGLRSVIQHWRRGDDRANQLLTMRKTARLLVRVDQAASAVTLLTALASASGDDQPARDAALLDRLASELGPMRYRAVASEARLVMEQDLPTLALDLIDAALESLDLSRRWTVGQPRAGP